MTKREFLFGLFVVIALSVSVGTVGYFVNQAVRTNIEIKAVEAKKAEIVEKERTERTKERWSFLNSWGRKKD